MVLWTRRTVADARIAQTHKASQFRLRTTHSGDSAKSDSPFLGRDLRVTENLNPYEPPETDGRNLSNDDASEHAPATSPRTLRLLRVVAGWQALCGLFSIAYPLYIAWIACLVLSGSRSAPWLTKPKIILGVCYWILISGVSLSLAAGLAMRRKWVRPLGVILLLVSLSETSIALLTDGESAKGRPFFEAVTIAVTLVPSLPLIVVLLSRKCTVALRTPSGGGQEEDRESGSESEG